jgi:Transglycosylase SLT domain/SPOR domain
LTIAFAALARQWPGTMKMRSLPMSTFLLSASLLASLLAGGVCDPTSVLAGEPSSNPSRTQAVKAPCPPQLGTLAPPSAGGPDKICATVSSGPTTTVDDVCPALAAAARANDLPISFFSALIWQESRFDPQAMSRAGAQGVAQFMPATASARGLADPFDPAEAIAKSAQLLRDLRHEFGNLGLAAAAYNAGPGRVRDWLAGRRDLPGETRAYVRLVTGRSAQEWVGAQEPPAEMHVANDVPCRQTAGVFADPSPRVTAGARSIWSVELVGSSSQTGALSAYHQLQQKYAALLAGLEPRVVFHGVVRDMGWARVRVDADSRASAERLCGNLRAAGAGCDVLRN